MQATKQLSVGRFAIDGLDGTYEGYTYGDTWNGWATPMFEKPVMDDIMAEFKSQGTEGPWEMVYVESTDTYVYDFDGRGESPDDGDTFVYDTTAPEPDGVDFIKGFNLDGRHLYEFSGWTWQDA